MKSARAAAKAAAPVSILALTPLDSESSCAVTAGIAVGSDCIVIIVVVVVMRKSVACHRMDTPKAFTDIPDVVKTRVSLLSLSVEVTVNVPLG